MMTIKQVFMIIIILKYKILSSYNILNITITTEAKKQVPEKVLK